MIEERFESEREEASFGDSNHIQLPYPTALIDEYKNILSTLGEGNGVARTQKVDSRQKVPLNTSPLLPRSKPLTSPLMDRRGRIMSGNFGKKESYHLFKVQPPSGEFKELTSFFFHQRNKHLFVFWSAKKARGLTKKFGGDLAEKHP